MCLFTCTCIVYQDLYANNSYLSVFFVYILLGISALWYLWHRVSRLKYYLAEVYKSIQTLKSIQIQFPFFELSWIESLHKNGIQELSWITYLLEMNWVWIELSLSTKRKNWIWFESSLTQKNLKELRVCKTWMRIHWSTHC